MSGPALSLLNIITPVGAAIGAYLTGRWSSRRHLPELANDVTDLYEKQRVLMERELAEAKKKIAALETGYATVQIQYKTLLDFVTNGGTGKCKDCPLLDQFRK